MVHLGRQCEGRRKKIWQCFWGSLGPQRSSCQERITCARIALREMRTIKRELGKAGKAKTL